MAAVPRECVRGVERVGAGNRESERDQPQGNYTFNGDLVARALSRVAPSEPLIL